jgi:hypothetical protein
MIQNVYEEREAGYRDQQQMRHKYCKKNLKSWGLDGASLSAFGRPTAWARIVFEKLSIAEDFPHILWLLFSQKRIICPHPAPDVTNNFNYQRLVPVLSYMNLFKRSLC